MEFNSKDPNWLDVDPTILNLYARGARRNVSRAPEANVGQFDAGMQDREVPVPRMGDAELFRLMATGMADASPSLGTTAESRAAAHLHVVPQERSEVANRALNVVIAVVSLILLAPVMALVALAVRLTSMGPVFYVQTRVGMDRRRRSATAVFDRRHNNVGGRAFRIIKFRSMRVDAEQGTGAVWATKSDPRVTPVGDFLRKTRLDELPQLILSLIHISEPARQAEI